jgi:hypothetical protein
MKAQATTTETDAPVLIDVGVRSKPDVVLEEQHLQLIIGRPDAGPGAPNATD